jgi:hypothetical protein
VSALAEQLLVYAGLNEDAESLLWLNRAVDDRSNPCIFLRVDPDFDHLREDPNFICVAQAVWLEAASSRFRETKQMR